jgi:hypothetical protein
VSLVPRTAAFRPAALRNLKRIRMKLSAMNNVEDVQGDPPATPSAPRKGRTNRCYQCNGRFGLVRHRLGLKQFCSTRCLSQYKTEVDRTTTRIKEWTHYLSRKL